MDLGTIRSQNSTVEIVHPGTGKKTGLILELRPMHDDAVKRVTNSIKDHRLKLAARNKNFKAEELESGRFEILSAAIAGWSWGKDDDGKEASFAGEQLKYTPVNVRRILEIDWIADQVDEALGDTGRFFQS